MIVIGASNREDLIDPAILRPGRLDVKIKIERPDADSAKQIFRQYLTTQPAARRDRAEGRRRRPRRSGPPHDRRTPSTHMYATGDENKFLEVTYQNGDKEILYFKDFSSGAMIENIVRRAKKLSIKRTIAGGERGHQHRRTCSTRSSRSSASTRTCRTRPTPTTGRRSPARRASASSSCARSSTRATRRPGRPSDRTGHDRPVPVTVDRRYVARRTRLTDGRSAWRDRTRADAAGRLTRVAVPKIVRDRDRVRRRAARRARPEPGARVDRC